MGKRDRWGSSSSEEDEGESRKRKQKRKKDKKKKKDTKKRSTTKPDDQGQSSAEFDVASSQDELLLQPKERRHNPLLHGCRSVYDTYDRVCSISEGTYGIVWKARDLATSSTVALKQIKFGVDETKGGFPVTALREINVLLELSHESVVSVKEVVVGDAIDKVFVVMEFYEFDLKDGISKFDGPLFQSELKGIMRQILSGIYHVHSKWYLHRDLKTSNVLVHRTGRIAIADFGLARRYEYPQTRPLTQLVVTLWYRAPELLFGEDKYGPPVDMWSIGCIFGELICKDAILQGQGELDQIDQIFSMVGVPSETNWPLFHKLPNAGLFRWKKKKSNKEEADVLLSQKFRVTATQASGNQAFLDSNGYDLLRRLLTLDPSRRLTAAEAQSHPYFTQGVTPQVPRFFSSST